MPGDLSLAAACDCHVHMVGPLPRFPQVASRTYTADPATLHSLQEAAAPAGISRFVLVQPSFYGTDNSCLLDTLAKLEGNGRGVATVNLRSVTPACLNELAQSGVRGLRLNLYSRISGADLPPLSDLLETAVQKLPSLHWHVEIVAPLTGLLAISDKIAQAGATIVIDHYGLPGNVAIDAPEGRALLDLVSLPHVWVKLSAPYRIQADPLGTRPPEDWLNALIQAAPDHCVWGSDWPHTPLDRDQHGPDIPAPYRKISYARLFGDFVAELPGRSLAKRILETNPARLYDFALK